LSGDIITILSEGFGALLISVEEIAFRELTGFA
jgi:hypothetical protein